MRELKPTDRIGDLVALHPVVTRVFMRHGISFCCGGATTLAEACRRVPGGVAAVLAELRGALVPAATPHDWERRPVGELVDHLVAKVHPPLKEELFQLQELAERVARVKGAKDPIRLPQLARLVAQLYKELVEHIAEQEALLFPWIRSGPGRQAAPPVGTMHCERDAAATHFDRIRQLTDGFRVPKEACTSWRNLLQRLADLEVALQEHLSLEQGVLLQRALGGI